MSIDIITALAAIASCIISAVNLYSTYRLTKYTVQATHDLESEKLFFHAKTEAYRAFLSTASEYMADPSAENTLRMNADCSYAVLFFQSQNAGRSEHLRKKHDSFHVRSGFQRAVR